MAQKKKTTSTVHASPSAAAAHFAQEAKAALSAGQTAAGEDIQAAPSAPTPDEICRVVEHCFGHSPKHVVRTLHRAVEAFNWLGALFECIEEANADGDLSQSAPRIQALASLGAYITSDYQVSIIGEPADEMQDCIEAALGGNAA